MSLRGFLRLLQPEDFKSRSMDQSNGNETTVTNSSTNQWAHWTLGFLYVSLTLGMVLKWLKKRLGLDSLVGPGVTTLCFHCGRVGFIPDEGTKIPHALHGSQKKGRGWDAVVLVC